MYVICKAGSHVRGGQAEPEPSFECAGEVRQRPQLRSGSPDPQAQGTRTPEGAAFCMCVHSAQVRASTERVVNALLVGAGAQAELAQSGRAVKPTVAVASDRAVAVDFPCLPTDEVNSKGIWQRAMQPIKRSEGANRPRGTAAPPARARRQGCRAGPAAPERGCYGGQQGGVRRRRGFLAVVSRPEP